MPSDALHSFKARNRQKQCAASDCYKNRHDMTRFCLTHHENRTNYGHPHARHIEKREYLTQLEESAFVIKTLSREQHPALAEALVEARDLVAPGSAEEADPHPPQEQTRVAYHRRGATARGATRNRRQRHHPERECDYVSAEDLTPRQLREKIKTLLGRHILDALDTDREITVEERRKRPSSSAVERRVELPQMYRPEARSSHQGGTRRGSQGVRGARDRQHHLPHRVAR